MALNDIERKRAEKTVQTFVEKHRPPPHIRPELDLGFRVSGQSVELFEVRPVWDRPQEKREHPVAKATFVRRQAIWKIYWRRAVLKWHRYEPLPEVANLDNFLAEVAKDEYGCFRG